MCVCVRVCACVHVCDRYRLALLQEQNVLNQFEVCWGTLCTGVLGNTLYRCVEGHSVQVCRGTLYRCVDGTLCTGVLTEHSVQVVDVTLCTGVLRDTLYRCVEGRCTGVLRDALHRCVEGHSVQVC